MSHIEKEHLIKEDMLSIENRVRHAFNQGYDLGYKTALKQAPTPKNYLGVDVPDNNVGNIDCISREQAKAAIRDKFKDLPSRVEINTILNELPSVTPQEPRWISVKDRLPEEHVCDDGYVEPSGYVLVFGDYGNYGVSRYWGDIRSKTENQNSCEDWMDLDWIVQKPIAWMPLPLAYKEVEDADSN